MKDKIIIRLGNIYSTIENLPLDVIKISDKGKKMTLWDFINYEISYEVPNLYFVQLSRPGWDGRVPLGSLSKKKPRVAKFLTGVFSRVVQTVYQYTKELPEVIDMRDKPSKNLNLDWDHSKFPLRDYQEDVVKECVNKGRGTILIATGGGKTIVVSKIIQELGVSPFIFYVLNKELMYQSKKRLESSISGLEVGLVGDGVCDIKPVTAMTVQTATTVYDIDIIKELKGYSAWSEGEVSILKKEKMDHLAKKKDIKELIENCKGIYFDEAHHSAAKTCKEIITKSKNAYYLFGGTATPEREDNAEILIEGLFGRPRCDIPASFLIKKGHLVPPNIYFIKLKNKYRAESFPEDYRTNITENDERNGIVISLANYFAKINRPTLLLVQQISHGKFLEKNIDGSVFVYGGTNNKKRKKSLQDFEDGKFPILIGSTIADEGLDLPNLSVLIKAGGGKAHSRAKQRVGRVIRTDPKNTFKKSLVFDFIDNGRWVSKHSKSRKKILETEEEFNIKVVSSLSEIPELSSMESLF